MDELLARIIESPDDLQLRRVYADRLLEAGDRRGELIALQCEQRINDTPDLTRRIAALITDLERNLFPGLQGFVPDWKWNLGFIDSIAIDVTDEPASKIDPLFTLPETRLVTRLQISSATFDGQGDLTAIWSRFGTLPLLRELLVSTAPNLGSPWHEGPPPIGDLSPLYRKARRLRFLSLDGVDYRLGLVDLPELENFDASGLTFDAVPDLARAKWPQLRTLELGFVFDVDSPNAFRPLLQQRFGEHLEFVHVTTRHHEWMRRELPDSPLGRGRVVKIGA